MALKVPTVQDHGKLVAIAVCDVEKEECMLVKCEDCPGGVALEQQFHELFEGEGCDLDEVKVSQWVNADGCDMVKLTISVNELILKLTNQVEVLAVHHFIKERQSSYLKSLKDQLPSGPSANFKHPKRIHQIWVPEKHILAVIEPATENHRQYHKSEEVQTHKLLR